MKELIELEKQIIPDLVEILKLRYSLLKSIRRSEPIGRRGLSNYCGLSERVVRSETNFLKGQGLIEIESSGMHITDQGNILLEKLKPIADEEEETNSLEVTLKEVLGVKNVIVVRGDSKESNGLFAQVGKAAANYLRKIIKDDYVISLTGGRTIKAMVDNFPQASNYSNIKVLPGRGGMGKEIETQSNTLVEMMANKLGASYELLHIPDNLSRNLFEALLDETEIKDIFNVIKTSDILIHGIGLAQEMCNKRNLTPKMKSEIMARGAIGEAFGHFFNKDGGIVYSMPSIAITEDGIDDIPNIVAVAVGIEKAGAILAVEKNRKNSTLVTDEVTAMELLRLEKLNT